MSELAKRAALLCGVVAALAALAFPFAPVRQTVTHVSWPAAGGGAAPVAVPLMPYQPATFQASFSCATVAALAAARPAGAVVLATTVDGGDTPWPLRSGLLVRAVGGQLLVDVGERTLLARPLPSGTACSWRLDSDPGRTEVRLDGAVVATVAGDARPQVAALVSDAEEAGAPLDGLSVSLTADTRFQTTIGPLKLALAVLAVLALLAALVLVALADRRGGESVHRVAVLPRGWWRPRPVDAAVLAVLAVWTLIGPITVDDGYISGIVRGRALNGFVGNYYHWFNAPEAPFGWFYEAYYLWLRVSAAPLWLRLPSALLGVLCWLLLHRLVLPRLRRGVDRGAGWVAAAVFLTWWLAFAVGLRPEPWIAVGTLVVFCAVERGLATGRVLPLLVGLLAAGLTLAVTPTGVIAFAPYLASLRPLLRLARRRSDLRWAPLVAITVAAGAAPLLVMFADQTYGAVAEATRVRTWIGPYLPWDQEIDRYSRLLQPNVLEGSLSRRVPVLFMLLALAVVGSALRRDGRLGRAGGLGRAGLAGVHRGAARRLLLAVALGLGALVFTPTKWTYHFGAFAGLGAAATVLALRTTTGEVVRTARARAAGIAVTAAVGGLALSGRNSWPYVSEFDLTWWDVPPVLLHVPIGTIMLYGGLALAAAVGLLAVWRETAGRGPLRVRWLPPPAPLVLAVVVLALLIEVGTFARASIERRHSYTLAADSRAALTGGTCGLADDLRVEPDPREGVLAPLPGAQAASDAPPIQPAPADQTDAAGQSRPAGEPPTDAQPPDGQAPNGQQSPTGQEASPSGESGATRLSSSDGFVTVPEAAGEAEQARRVPGGPGYGLPGWRAERSSPPATIRTGWYALTADVRSGALPVVISVDRQLNPHSSITVELGRRTPAGTVEVRRQVPLRDDIGGGQQDLRVLVPHEAPDADSVRVLATSSGGIVFSVPRAPRVVRMSQAVPTTATVVADWPVSFLFPCYRLPSLVDGVSRFADYRIGPPRSDDFSTVITYAPAHGGPLAGARTLVREERLPLYLAGDPMRDAAQVYRWVPVRELAPAELTLETETVAGWRRGPHITIPVDESLDLSRRRGSR